MFFDLNDLPPDPKFELVTAIEVFEHLPNPIAEIQKMLEFSDNLLFSTELQPENINSVDDWIYFSTETGQHIAFYNEASLSAIAAKLGYYFYSDGSFLHLFTKKEFDHNPFNEEEVKDDFWIRKAKRHFERERKKLDMPESLLDHDWNFIRDKPKDQAD